MESFRLQGNVPVIPTPFRDDESIDLDALASCIEFAVKCRVCAVCLPAYGSEFYKMTITERRDLIEVAVRSAAGRVAVIGQSNHPSARCAAELAARHEDLGVQFISFAIPRQFSLTDADVLSYCRTICQSVSLPVLIQDFNPGGPTVGGEFARQLQAECQNFRYLKLEEPLMSAKVEAIRKATNDEIGVLEGWGGMYLLDLLPAGICGCMPGLGAVDLLQRIWELGSSNQLDKALDLFERLLPQLVFSLQNMELFVLIEKKLLAARGVLPASSTNVRTPTWTPDSETMQYGLKLNERVIAACNEMLV